MVCDTVINIAIKKVVRRSLISKPSINWSVIKSSSVLMINLKAPIVTITRGIINNDNNVPSVSLARAYVSATSTAVL